MKPSVKQGQGRRFMGAAGATFAFVFSMQGASARDHSNMPWLGRLKADHVVAASSPDNSYEILRSLINSAKRVIHLSVYQLDNPFIGDALEKAITERNVSVKILVEGAPIPKIPQGELYIAKRLAKKGAKFYFYDDPNGRSGRKFKYLHAKYGIFDDRRAIVGSANYGNNGHPVDSTAGNREWEIVLNDPKAAVLFEAAFEHDLTKGGDWVQYGASDRYTLHDPDYEPDRSSRGGHYGLDLSPVEAFDVPMETVFAPDNSLDEDGPLLGALGSADRSVDIEQLNFETYWGGKPYNPEREESPMMSRILDLARKGRRVRVLLNDDGIFRDPDRPRLLGELFSPIMSVGQPIAAPEDDGPESDAKPARDNKSTLNYLMKLSKREGWDLNVRFLDYRNCGLGVLHNKGMIVDGELALVGSLNWGESALKFNREAGVIVKSEAVARYYTRAFDYDWRCSGGGSVKPR